MYIVSAKVSLLGMNWHIMTNIEICEEQRCFAVKFWRHAWFYRAHILWFITTMFLLPVIHDIIMAGRLCIDPLVISGFLPHRFINAVLVFLLLGITSRQTNCCCSFAMPTSYHVFVMVLAEKYNQNQCATHVVTKVTDQPIRRGINSKLVNLRVSAKVKCKQITSC